MTAGLNRDITCIILNFLLLKSRDLVEGVKPRLYQVTSLEILLTFRWGISRKNFVTFEVF